VANPSVPEWLTVAEVADELRIPRKQVYAMIRENELPAYRVGRRRIRVNRQELYKCIKSVDHGQDNQRV
jgi:excisionase family DNA binding protein